MEDDVKKEKMRHEEIDRLHALLALALTKDAPQGRHITPEKLVAWREGRLKADERERIQVHLSQCDECYTNWMEQIEFGDVEPASFSELLQMWRQRIVCWFKVLPSIGKVGFTGGGLATALAMLLLIINIFTSVPIGKMVDDSYSTFLNSVPVSQIPQDWPFVPQRGTRGTPKTAKKLFAEVHAAERLAFLSGVRAGLEKTQKSLPAFDDIIANLPENAVECPERISEGSCTSLKKNLQEAGKWAVLLHLACETEPASISADFWKEQQGILSQLSKQINKLEVSDNLRSFFLDWNVESAKTAAPRDGVCLRVDSLMRDALIE